MNFDQLFDILSKEMSQVQQDGDADNDYQFVNPEDAMFYANECIKELVSESPEKFIKEETVVFHGDTDRYVAPETVCKIYNYFDASKGQWRVPADASDMSAPVRMVSNNELYFSTTRSEGDELLLRISKYPPEINEPSDAIPFPSQHMRLLRFRIIIKALGTGGKDYFKNNVGLSNEWARRERAYMGDTRKVSSATRLARKGYGFGRRS